MCLLYICMNVLCVCVGFMALTIAMVLNAESQDSLLSVSVRPVHVVFSTAPFEGEGKPCPKAHYCDCM